MNMEELQLALDEYHAYVNTYGKCGYVTDFSGVDFRDTDLRYNLLRGANLANTNLSQVIFYHTDLSGAYMRGAVLPNKLPIPVVSNIHRRVYEAANQPNALDMNEWHTCGTKHCWAGWIVTLAGDLGKSLEAYYGTNVAAAFILMKNDPDLEQIPNWYQDEESALAAMERLANK